MQYRSKTISIPSFLTSKALLYQINTGTTKIAIVDPDRTTLTDIHTM